MASGIDIWNDFHNLTMNFIWLLAVFLAIFIVGALRDTRDLTERN